MSEQKYVIFSIESNKYAFSIDKVERILHQVACTPIPRAPKLLMGVFELRGETIPALSLRQRFGFNATTNEGNFIIVHSSAGRYAIQCDEVLGIIQAEDSCIESAPDLALESDDFIEGILKFDNNLHVVLDVNEVVPASLRKKISQFQLQEVA